MKQRIITGCVIAAVVIPCLIFINTAVFACLIAFISAVAIYEVINAVGCKNLTLKILSCVIGAAVPFLFHFRVNIPFLPTAIGVVILYFILMVIMHSKTTFNDVSVALFSTAAISVSLSLLISMRDVSLLFPKTFDKSAGLFFIFTAFIAAWGTDIFAYFVGSKFGRHKITPVISPKKSLEGAIGGVVGAVILSEILFVVFDFKVFEIHEFKWYHVLLTAAALSVVSMFGDLSASILKRNHDIKDFGKILPGHGGIMDRVDSLLFVVPSLYFIIYVFSKVAGVN